MDSSKQRPDLAGGARGRSPAGHNRNGDSGGTGTGSHRILAELEHGSAAPRQAGQQSGHAAWRLRIDGWTAGLCVLLAGMCVLAWLMHEQAVTPQTFKRQPRSAPDVARSSATHASASRRSDDGRPHADTGVQAGHHAQAAATVTPAPTATIVTLPFAHPAGSVLTTSPPTTGISPATVTSATSTADTANAAGTTRTTSTTSPPATPAAPGSIAARKTAMQPSKLPANTPQRPDAAGDTDVALLTALVAHGGRPVSVTPERSRDVVMRSEGDDTAALLARCRQLGLIESMLCRSRICTGSWESDPACRAPAH